jgi:hydrogenase/urease accessory protein HupE
MRKIFSSLLLIGLIAIHTPVAFAQEEVKAAVSEKSDQAEETASKATDKLKDAASEVAKDVQKEVDTAKEKLDDATDTAEKENSSSLMNDIKKARAIIIDGVKKDSGSSILRGMIIAFLQPIFIASMFCLGLWAGQMSEKLKHIWALPVIMYAATIIGAFITAYHAEWKPDEEHYKFLHALQSTEVVSVIIGLFLGILIALQFVMPAFFAMLAAVAIGLILGFSQTSDMGDSHTVMKFWAGFGLTGLLVNIFGIGFETFFQSINLKLITRLVGVATAILSVYIGAKLL